MSREVERIGLRTMTADIRAVEVLTRHLSQPIAHEEAGSAQ